MILGIIATFFLFLPTHCGKIIRLYLIDAYVDSIPQNQCSFHFIFQFRNEFVVDAILKNKYKERDFLFPRLCYYSKSSILTGIQYVKYTWTKIRFVVTQVWPVFLNLDAIQPSTAKLRSAELNTINGALPPNSKDNFLTVLAHCSYNIFPSIKKIFNTIIKWIVFKL